MAPSHIKRLGKATLGNADGRSTSKAGMVWYPGDQLRTVCQEGSDFIFNAADRARGMGKEQRFNNPSKAGVIPKRRAL